MNILQPHHIKYGYTVQEDDHVIEVRRGFHLVGRWAIGGIMSADTIREAVDQDIINHLEPHHMKGKFQKVGA